LAAKSAQKLVARLRRLLLQAQTGSPISASRPVDDLANAVSAAGGHPPRQRKRHAQWLDAGAEGRLVRAFD